MKYELYASLRRSDGRILRYVVRFDTLDDVVLYLRNNTALMPTFKLVQTYVGLSCAERDMLPVKSECYEQELPF